MASYGAEGVSAYRPAVTTDPIDREGPIPPYRQIAAALRAQIVDGTIPVGRRIPSTVELEQTYLVARDTLRKAVKVLRDEGLVETVTGMGVYVVRRPEE